MMLSDPFERDDSRRLARRHARLACRIIGLVMGAGLSVGARLAPHAVEPFMHRGVVVLLALLRSYVL